MGVLKWKRFGRGGCPKMEDVWRAHKSRVGKKCSPKKVNKGGCPKVEDYREKYNVCNICSKMNYFLKVQLFTAIF